MIEYVKETVREAGELLLDGYEGDSGIRNIARGSNKLVTEYDLESERLIVSRLNSRWKGYNIVSEEEMSAKKGSEFTWLIDPLDGTTSFIKRSPFFSISVALVRGREIVLGVVYAPALGEMYEAVKGGGGALKR